MQLNVGFEICRMHQGTQVGKMRKQTSLTFKVPLAGAEGFQSTPRGSIQRPTAQHHPHKMSPVYVPIPGQRT